MYAFTGFQEFIILIILGSKCGFRFPTSTSTSFLALEAKNEKRTMVMIPGVVYVNVTFHFRRSVAWTNT